MKRPGPEQQQEHLDASEEVLSAATDRAVRAWLRRVNASCQESIGSGAVVAAAAPLPAASGEPSPTTPVTLGEATRWWEEAVNAEVAAAVREVWLRGYLETAEGVVTESSLAGLDRYVATVTDRLVRGIEPPLPAAAMDKVRVAVTQSIALGWSNQALSERIAADLSWAPQQAYWQAQYDSAGDRIDALLDPYGPPGSPVREAARLSDPAVRALQSERSAARLALDAEETYWRTRANRIARTESTGAYNDATIRALADEGAEFKEWVATRDARTRASHVAADGQQQPLDQPFTVGGSSLMHPGSPGAPAHEVVNCRCTVIGRFADEVSTDVRERATPPTAPSVAAGPGGAPAALSASGDDRSMRF